MAAIPELKAVALAASVRAATRRKLCEIISKNWIFPNPFDKEPFDADVAGKKASFKAAGIEYTINQIDEYRACGVDGIHLYALNKYDDVANIAKLAGLIDLV